MKLIQKNKEVTILLILLSVSAFYRLFRIDEYMTFLGDEGRDALVVYNILHGDLTLLGPTASVGGFFLGPIYYYFMAPFLWLFNYNPVGPAVMVGLFGIATVWLVYRIGSEFFSRQAGVAAAALYSISPLVVAYSRSSWQVNLMPFFSILTLYTLYKALEKNSTKLVILSGILFGITIQLHYLAFFVAAIMIGYTILIRFFLEKEKAIHKIQKTLLDGIKLFIGFIIGWSPFLAFEVRHGFPNIQSIIKFIFQSDEVQVGDNLLTIVGNVFFRLFARLVANYPPPEQISIQANTNFALWYYATLLLAFVSLGIFIYQYFWAWKKNIIKKRQLSLLFLWLLIGVFLFGFYKKPIYDYYFGFMFPLPFLLVGNGLASIWKKNRLFMVVSLVAILLLLWINLQGIPFRYPANRQAYQVREIAHAVLDKTDGKPFNFALITLGNSDHAYRYFFKLAGRDPVTIENTNKDPERKTVTDQLLIICEDPNCKPLGHPLWEVAGFGRAEIAGYWQVSVLQVYKLVHYTGK